jgi:hypothetical protein
MGVTWAVNLTKARAAILGLGIASALLSCSKDPGKRSKADGEFSRNPIIIRLLEQSRATVQKERGLRREQLSESHYPKYVETKNSVCIIWFPTPIDAGAMVLDDRMTYVTCLGSKDSLTDPMEYHEYRE